MTTESPSTIALDDMPVILIGALPGPQCVVCGRIDAHLWEHYEDWHCEPCARTKRAAELDVDPDSLTWYVDDAIHPSELSGHFE